VTLVERGHARSAVAHDASHVDLVDGVDVGADSHALRHALGDDGAHAGEWDHLRWGGPPAFAGDFGFVGRGSFAAHANCGDGAEDVGFGDAAAGTGAGDAGEIDAVLAGDAAGERRGTEAAGRRRLRRRGHLGWGRLLGERWCGG